MQLDTITFGALISLPLLVACGPEARLLEEGPLVLGSDPDAEVEQPLETEPVLEEPRPVADEGRPAAVTTTELGVLALVNDWQETNLERLDIDCELRTDSATNIIGYRDGDDGVAGTDDDQLFSSLGALEGLPRVGEWTISRLRGCADQLGYLPTAAEAGALLMLNDLSETDLELLDHICGLRSDSAHSLIEHRNGDDERPGTSDDDLFDTIWEVEGVYMVGEWTIERLMACAERLEYVAVDPSEG